MDRRDAISWSVAVFLKILDVYLTIRYIDFFGTSVEANPLISWLVSSTSVYAIIPYTIGVMLLLFLLYRKIWEEYKFLVPLLLIASHIIVLFWNMGQALVP